MPGSYPLKDFNSWKAGGECALLIAPHTVSEAADFLRICRQRSRPFYILGGGTNVLIANGFLDASVLYTGHINGISAEDLGSAVRLDVACGFETKKLLSFAVERGLGGVEFLAGIPGSLGGALWGNAGARGGEGFAQIVEEITVVGEDCEIKHYEKEALAWRYRSCPVSPRELMILSCRLLLQKTEKKKITDRIRQFSELKKGQPLGKNTAGCVFKNPEGMSAGKLLDEAGCKGMRIGGAEVSASHANFIENTGNASSGDIYRLCEACRAKVFEKYGIRLEYEIHFFGRFEKD